MGSKGKNICHFVPSKLDINKLINILDGVCKNTNLTTQKVLNFYTVILKRMINNIYFEANNSKYVYMNYYEVRCLLGEKYKEVIKRLVESHFLLENDNWKWNHNIPGLEVYPKSYSIPLSLFSKGRIYKLIDVKNLKSVKNMINRFNNLRTKKNGCDKWRKEMIESSYRLLLKETPECLRTIQEHIDDVNNRNKKIIIKLTAKEMLDLFNYYPFNNSIVDLFGKRVHTKITNMPKELRKFLYFENRADEKLECVDIVNSQPSFMSAATPLLINQFTPELKEAEEIVSRYSNDLDLLKFRQLCSDGKIYEEIMKYYNNYGKQIDRDQAKVICYVSFFGNYTIFEMGKLKNEVKKLAYKFLKEEFRGVYNLFKEMKSNKWSENHRKQYANNCMLAQRLESQIFYQIIVPALWNAGFRDFTTIHDSILCPESDVAKVKDIMISEFKRLKINLLVK